MPLPNQQPEWLNAPANSDSTASQSDSSAAQIFVSAFRNAPPTHSMITISSNSDSNGSIVCQRHRTTISQTVTFDIDGIREIYCLGCIRDALRERIVPIHWTHWTPEATDSTSSKESVQLFSRYDLLKGKDATGTQRNAISA